MSNKETKDELETHDDYHADVSHVSASMLKALAKSPRHFQAAYINQRMKVKPSAAMELGTAVHCLALTPMLFDQQYAICPQGCDDRRTKVHKEWRAFANVGSRRVLKHDELQTIDRCVQELHSDEIIRNVLTRDGECEATHRCVDEGTGVHCKIRPDKILPDLRIVLDIKTTQDVEERKFMYTVKDYRYDLQAAHYIAGAVDRYGGQESDWAFIFAAIETDEPFNCRAFQLDASWMHEARMDRLTLLEEYRTRTASGDWSCDYENEITLLSKPRRKGTQ